MFISTANFSQFNVLGVLICSDTHHFMQIKTLVKLHVGESGVRCVYCKYGYFM